MGSTGLRCEVLERRPVALVEVAGSLHLDTVNRIRFAVEKMLADSPDVAVLDVAGLHEVDERCVSIFPTVGRLAAACDVPLVLAAPSASLRRAFRVTPLFVRVADSRAEAIALCGRRTRSRGRGRWRLGLVADMYAPARARRLVEQAYQNRGLGDLCRDAVLVANELVTNAVQHVGCGEVGLEVSFLRRYVRIEVRDQGTTPARSAKGCQSVPGYGLRMVTAVSVRWGCAPDQDGGGKVVWADLPLDRPAH
jgi:ABC-type transporter Mla MlaB component